MMNTQRPLRSASCILLALIVTLALVPGASAQSTFKTLHKFTLTDPAGTQPNSLIFDQAGNLYGTTVSSVFKLTPNADGSWSESVLYSFTNCSIGCDVTAGVTFGAAGILYGTTARGGANSSGTVFSLTPNLDGSWTESVLYSFGATAVDGIYPYAGLIIDQAGNLFGTTGEGGASGGGGTVFELSPNTNGTWKESVLHSFDYFTFPEANLVMDSAGNLYSTTTWGGDGCCGVVFKLSPNSDGTWTEQILYSFLGGSDGGNPFGSLIFDQAGNLYGMTLSGGINLSSCDSGCGVAFQLSPNLDGTWQENVLHSFCSVSGCRDGGDGLATPGTFTNGALVFDQGGNLYGTTWAGGAYGWGVVFKLGLASNSKWKGRVLHAFMNDPGSKPFDGLIFDGAGNLYGTTVGDGRSSYGSVFELTP